MIIPLAIIPLVVGIFIKNLKWDAVYTIISAVGSIIGIFSVDQNARIDLSILLLIALPFVFSVLGTFIGNKFLPNKTKAQVAKKIAVQD